MFTRSSFAITLAMLLAAAICATAQTSRPAHKPATTTSHSASSRTAHARHHAREPRGQMVPAPDRISEIQTALARDNAYQGDPTGKWDAATIAAMKQFQSAHGLSPTGKIDALTLQRLGLGSDVAGKGAPSPVASPSPATPSASIQGGNDATQ
ncbi:MAG: peptidoglycan-binding domain-containing protein [Candidatus Acidiferrales bacterium]